MSKKDEHIENHIENKEETPERTAPEATPEAEPTPEEKPEAPAEVAAQREMEVKKRYYSIGEVAERFDVSTSLIRFWEGQFETIKPRKNKAGVRQYTQEDIDALSTIYYLVKVKGYTLNGAKDAIKKKPLIHSKIEAINILERTKKFLQDMSARLEEAAKAEQEVAEIGQAADSEAAKAEQAKAQANGEIDFTPRRVPLKRDEPKKIKEWGEPKEGPEG